MVIPVDGTCFDDVIVNFYGCFCGSCSGWTVEVNLEKTEFFSVITKINIKLDFCPFTFISRKCLTKNRCEYLRITSPPFVAVHQTPCNVTFDFTTIFLLIVNKTETKINKIK